MQHQHRMAALGEDILIRLPYCMGESPIPHPPAIDEEVLLIQLGHGTPPASRANPIDANRFSCGQSNTLAAANVRPSSSASRRDCAAPCAAGFQVQHHALVMPQAETH